MDCQPNEKDIMIKHERFIKTSIKEGYAVLINENEIVGLPKGTRYLTPAQLEANKKKREWDKKDEERELQKKRSDQNRGRHFVKCYVEGMKKVTESDLNPIQLGHFMRLTMLLRFEDNILYNGGNKLSKANIREYLGLKETQGNKFINDMIKLEFISEHPPEKNGLAKYYSINPNIHEMGKDEFKKEFIKLYRKAFKEFTNGLTPAQVGILYKILPYFNINFYCLTSNPECKDEDLLDTFENRTELANRLGINRKSLDRAIAAFKDEGIMIEVEKKRRKMLYVHPYLVFRQDIKDENVEYTKSIVSLFNQMEQFASILEPDETI